MNTYAERNLASRSGRVPTLMFAGMLVVLGGCERGQPAPNGVLDSIVAANPCDGTLPEVTRVPDSLTQPQSCALLAAATKRLAEAGTGDLPQSADASGVAAATIDAMSERDFSEKVKGAWWVVTLQMRNTPFNVEVRFDRRTGATGIRSVHK